MFASQAKNQMTLFSGCYTAIATPMTKLRDVDYEGLRSLIEFQVREGVQGILAVGTTGESPTLDWNEHNKVIERTKDYASDKCVTIAGTGSNSTQETIEATVHAQHIGIRNILLVQLLMIIVAPAHALQVCRELLKIWRSINAQFLHMGQARTNKNLSRFWEIDMTKFEP